MQPHITFWCLNDTILTRSYGHGYLPPFFLNGGSILPGLIIPGIILSPGFMGMSIFGMGFFFAAIYSPLAARPAARFVTFLVGGTGIGAGIGRAGGATGRTGWIDTGGRTTGGLITAGRGIGAAGRSGTIGERTG